MVTEAEWERVRDGLRFGRSSRAPSSGCPGPGRSVLDIGLGVGGFVDVALLPRRSEDWPAEGTVTDFEVWWVHGDHQQVRLKPSDPQYLCEDFADFVARFRPHWPSGIGEPW